MKHIIYKTRPTRARYDKFSNKKHINHLIKQRTKAPEVENDLTAKQEKFKLVIKKSSIEMAACLIIIVLFLIFA